MKSRRPYFTCLSPSNPDFKYFCEQLRWGDPSMNLKSAKTYTEMMSDELAKQSPRKRCLKRWARKADFYYHLYIIAVTWPEVHRRGKSGSDTPPSMGAVLQHEKRTRMLWLSRVFTAFADNHMTERGAGRKVAGYLKRADFYYHAYVIKGEWNA